MKNFCEELKAIRESKNISVQDISKETRINVIFIEAIEAGNLSILPQTYMRAFIKSYAKCIGLNPEETVSKFQQYIGKKQSDPKVKPDLDKQTKTSNMVESTDINQTSNTNEPATQKTNEPVTTSNTSQDSKDNTKDNNIENTFTQTSEPTYFEENNLQKEYVKYVETPKVNYLILFCSIAIVAIILIFVIFKLPIEPTTHVSIDTIVKETERRYGDEKVVPKIDSVPVIPFIRSDSLKLGILTSVDVWISVRMDQNGADRGVVYANTLKHVMAKEKFSITATKGTQVKIYLNGNFLGNLSQTDSLRTAVVTANGINYLKPTVPKPDPTRQDTDLKPLEPLTP